MDEFTIIQDGKLFVVIDQHGDPKFDSYWEKDCHDWIADYADWDDDDTLDYEDRPEPWMVAMMSKH